jgi:hypothetical protein
MNDHSLSLSLSCLFLALFIGLPLRAGPKAIFSCHKKFSLLRTSLAIQFAEITHFIFMNVDFLSLKLGEPS